MHTYLITSGDYDEREEIRLIHKEEYKSKKFHKLFAKAAKYLIKKGKIEDVGDQDAIEKIAKYMCKKFGFKYLQYVSAVAVKYTGPEHKHPGTHVSIAFKIKNKK
jgi:hypothetical protein